MAWFRCDGGGKEIGVDALLTAGGVAVNASATSEEMLIDNVDSITVYATRLYTTSATLYGVKEDGTTEALYSAEASQWKSERKTLNVRGYVKIYFTTVNNGAYYSEATINVAFGTLADKL